jgi:hypothetical protein
LPELGAGGMAQVVEHQGPKFNPHTTKKERREEWEREGKSYNFRIYIVMLYTMLPFIIL